MKKIFILTIFLILITSALFFNSFATSKYGSSGDEVKQIQTKLKSWGYY